MSMLSFKSHQGTADMAFFGRVREEVDIKDCNSLVCASLILHFCRSESVERDGTAFFAQQGLDEDYGTGEGQGVSHNFMI